MARFAAAKADRLPVIDNEEERHLVGAVAAQDLYRAVNLTLINAEAETKGQVKERGWPPTPSGLEPHPGQPGHPGNSVPPWRRNRPAGYLHQRFYYQAHGRWCVPGDRPFPSKAANW